MAIEVRYHRIPTAILGIGDFLGKLAIEKGNRIRYTIYTIRFFGLKMGYTPKRNGHRHQLNRAEAAAQVSLPRPIGHAQPEVEGLEQWPYDTVCWPLSWICWRWCGNVAYFANGTSTTWGIHRNVFFVFGVPRANSGCWLPTPVHGLWKTDKRGTSPIRCGVTTTK